MKEFLRYRSRRWLYDGWALRVHGATTVLEHTVCTTRREARELKQEWEREHPDMFRKLDIVKIRLRVEAL